MSIIIITLIELYLQMIKAQIIRHEALIFLELARKREGERGFHIELRI